MKSSARDASPIPTRRIRRRGRRKQRLCGNTAGPSMKKGRLCSAMIQLDYGCHFGGQETKLLGIGGVVSDPAMRRNGGIRALFEEGLPRARREGYTFSALYPFSHVFYRKFGYELAQVSREAVLEPQALRDDLRGAAEISLVLPEDAEGRTAVRQVYEDYARETQSVPAP